MHAYKRGGRSCRKEEDKVKYEKVEGKFFDQAKYFSNVIQDDESGILFATADMI
jgi:hypothetical protein